MCLRLVYGRAFPEMVVALLKMSRVVGGFLFLNRKLYTVPRNLTLTHKTTTRWAQLERKTKVLVAKVSVVKVTANSAASQNTTAYCVVTNVFG